MSFEAKHATLLTVKSMDRAVKFYTDVLGGKVLMRDKGEMKDFFASLKVAGPEFWLISPQEREKVELAYSSIIVKDIRAVVAELKAKGVKFTRAERMNEKTKVEGPIAFDENMGSSAFFKDTEGNLLMLWQGTM